MSWDGRQGPIIIGVAGASGSGKTTMCNEIKRRLGKEKIVIISLDMYYLGLPEMFESHPEDYNFDDPKALDFELIFNQIQALKDNAEIEIPMYDFSTHSRLPAGSGQIIRGADVIIFEGLFTLHNAVIRDMLDLCLFAVEDPDTCLVRRLKRDIVERGRDVMSVLEQYEKFVKPGFTHFIQPSMLHADIIVPRAGRNLRLIKLIVNNIHKKLYPESPTPRHSPTPSRSPPSGEGVDGGGDGGEGGGGVPSFILNKEPAVRESLTA